MAAVLDKFYGTGRRKTSIARVWIRPGSGRISVNARAFEDYFPRETLRMIITQPLQVTNTVGQFDVIATVGGGGPSGQAGAVRHGIARALAPSTKNSGCRSRRRGSSRAIRACASGRSTVSLARARSSSTRSASARAA